MENKKSAYCINCGESISYIEQFFFDGLCSTCHEKWQEGKIQIPKKENDNETI